MLYGRHVLFVPWRPVGTHFLMLHALAAVTWLPAAPGRQAVWCGARQLRSGTAWLPLRPRLCPSPQMQTGRAREAHTGGEAASVDALVDELSEVVATHARSPLPLGELHRSLQTLTAKAAAALESGAAEPGAAPPPPSPPPPPGSGSVSATLTVAELKAELKARGLPISGLKAELLARLAAAAPVTSLQPEAGAGSSSNPPTPALALAPTLNPTPALAPTLALALAPALTLTLTLSP